MDIEDISHYMGIIDRLGNTYTYRPFCRVWKFHSSGFVHDICIHTYICHSYMYITVALLDDKCD